MFDILITVSQKDFNKLPFVLESINFHIKGIHKYHLIAPVTIPEEYIWVEADVHRDEEVIDFDFSKIKMTSRQGWYRQQFIKLFQQVTTNNYLVVDADTIINKPIEIEPASPCFFLGRDQHHLPYFHLMKTVLDLDRVYPHSFISELMFFKRGMIQYLLNEKKMTPEEFFNSCVEVINQMNEGSGFSEYELYGNFVSKYWPNAYTYKNVSVCHRWKKRRWTDDEIRNYVSTFRHTNNDLLTMHSWL
jgi:hypothetical protein